MTGQWLFLLGAWVFATWDLMARQLDRIEDDLGELLERLIHHTFNDPKSPDVPDWMERYSAALQHERGSGVFRLRNWLGFDESNW